MKTSRTGLTRMVLMSVCLIAANSQLATAQTNRDMTKADVDRLIKELSNWGRWGKDDQLGALNLITEQKRREAAKLVVKGVSVSMARIPETKEAVDNASPFIQKMIKSGQDLESQWAMDNFSVSYHGVSHTHMDSLCHLFYNGKMYNGFTRDQVTSDGAKKLSIHNVQQGIFSRGFLIDIPALRGVKYLEPGSAIYPEELDAWENRIGIKIGKGDIVFFRTGRWARRDKLGAWDVSKEGLAGLHASCAKWLKDRDVAMVGSDAAMDVIPSRIKGISHPVHLLTLHAMGVHIFDNCDLEELSRVTGKMKRWHFLITASPIPVRGGTGSPLNPIATF